MVEYVRYGYGTVWNRYGRILKYNKYGSVRVRFGTVGDRFDEKFGGHTVNKP